MAHLEVHLEWSWHALRLPENWPPRPEAFEYEATNRLLQHLARRRVLATFYILGHLAHRSPSLVERIARDHHVGSHGYWHRHDEWEHDASDQLARRYLPECVGYRSPFWDHTPRPGWSGGAFFRCLPYPWLKREVLRSGVLWLHPHDLVPQATGPWRRRVTLEDPWQRLDRLLEEIPFGQR